MNLSCKILHVEDDDNDSLFFQRALARLDFIGVYRRVVSADKALEYLQGMGAFTNREFYPLPDVVVMDTALPGVRTGLDVVRWLTAQPELNGVAKVVLTGGMALDQQQELLSHGIAGILLKGLSVFDMATAVEAVLGKCIR
jgi:CheY-like chemotaxis protein